MPKFIDLTGQKFGRLTVIANTELNNQNRAMWLCRCSCGKEKVIRSDALVSGWTKSCSCLQKESARKGNHKTHGHTTGRQQTSVYMRWVRMVQRCTNPNDKAYKHYGGRGIKVCDRWLESFENFLADMRDRPTPQHSIDRIDNNGDYTPDNCRWATWKEQANNKRTNIKLAFGAETKTIGQWADYLGLKYTKLYYNLFYRKQSIEDVIREVEYARH